MTLINIANGTECRRRDEEVRTRVRARAQVGDSGGLYGAREAEDAREGAPSFYHLFLPTRFS